MAAVPEIVGDGKALTVTNTVSKSLHELDVIVFCTIYKVVCRAKILGLAVEFV
jgi:hypothetical protein